MESMLRDVRYAARGLRKAPGFTTVAVLTLALGIGANTAIFSLANAFLLKPLKIHNPEEVVGCYSVDSHKPDASRAFSYPNYADLRDRNSVFSSLAAHDLTAVGLAEGDTSRRVPSDFVSSNYFATMDVPLFKGRTFTDAEEKPGAGIPVVIVSYSFWEKHGSDPELLGKTLRLNGRIFTVVGIAPEGFTGTVALVSSELYLPLGTYSSGATGSGTLDSFQADESIGGGKSLSARANATLILVGRLKSGVKERDANAQLAVVASQMEKAYPAENKDQTFIVRPLARLSVSPSPEMGRQPAGLVILAMMSMPAVVLLIASLNLANMMLARGAARNKEIAIRLAIGGGRGRIVRQLCTEGFLLAILGGAAGLLVASWGSALLMRSLVPVVPFDMVFSSKSGRSGPGGDPGFLYAQHDRVRSVAGVEALAAGRGTGLEERRRRRGRRVTTPVLSPERAGDGAAFAFADDADGERTLCSQRDASGACGARDFRLKTESSRRWIPAWRVIARPAGGRFTRRSLHG